MSRQPSLGIGAPVQRARRPALPFPAHAPAQEPPPAALDRSLLATLPERDEPWRTIVERFAPEDVRFWIADPGQFFLEIAQCGAEWRTLSPSGSIERWAGSGTWNRVLLLSAAQIAQIHAAHPLADISSPDHAGMFRWLRPSDPPPLDATPRIRRLLEQGEHR